MGSEMCIRDSDIDNEIDERYKDLIVNELTFIRENTSKIIKNAVVMS